MYVYCTRVFSQILTSTIVHDVDTVDRRCDRRTDGRTDGQMDRYTKGALGHLIFIR